MKTTTHTRATFWASAVLIGGIGASLAGNIQAIQYGADTGAHTYAAAVPGVGVYVSAIFWPLALFGVIEVMLHTPWLATWRDILTRWVGLLGAALMALYISYGHLATVLDAYGYDWLSAHFGPAAVDVTMVMATLALNRVGHARRVTPAVPVSTSVTPAVTPVTSDTVQADQSDTVLFADIVRTRRDTVQPDDYVTLDRWDSDQLSDPDTSVSRPVSEYDNWTAGYESAIDQAGQELASEAEALANGVTPAVPVVPGVTTDVLPVRMAIPPGARTLIQEWLDAPSDGAFRASLADLSRALSDAHNVSTRTARRWIAAVKDGR